MPVFSRANLRHQLSSNYVRDMLLGVNQASLGAGAGSMYVYDVRLADLSLSGLSLYQGGHFLINSQQYLIASFNVASGAFVSGERAAAAVPDGSAFEVHWLLSPVEKDRCLNETLRHIRVRQEVTRSAIAGAEFYAIDTLASPHRLADVLNVYAYAAPAGSLSREKYTVPWWGIGETPTGTELRIYPALSASWLLVVDAVLEQSLGLSSEATINLPDDSWIVTGAAARAAELLTRAVPADAARRRVRGTAPPSQFEPPPPSYWREKQREWAREFTRLSGIYAPRRNLRPQLDEPY